MSATIERALPQAVDSERAVLGAIIIENEHFDTAQEILEAENFFYNPNGKIFSMMCAMREDGKEIDLRTLVDALSFSGELETVGGAGYVASLIDGIPKIINVKSYARSVKYSYGLRRVIHTAYAAQEEAFEGRVSLTKILESSVTAMVDLQTEVFPEIDGVTEREAAVNMLKEMEKRDGPRTYSGIEQFDERTGGGREGELWCYVAGTGIGKTIFARQIAETTCERTGWHTLYGSGEMYAHHLASRRVFPQANVNPTLARFPERISSQQYTALVEASGRQCDKCRILDGELTLSRIRVAARKMAKECKLGFVVGDYDQLIDAPGKTPLDKQINLIRGMKSIAMENHCNVALVAQFRKLIAAGQEPTLEDVFGSKSAVAHPTAVIYVNRTFVDDKNAQEVPAKISILKFRDGRTGEIEASFNIRRLRFEAAVAHV